MLSFTYDGVDSFDTHHYQHRSPSLMSTFTASSSLFPSPSPSYVKRETSRLFDYASPSTPTRSEGEWRQQQQQAEEPKSQGDLAKVDHDHVIYGALLEECNDTSNCIGVAAGCYKAHGWNSWQVARRDPRKFNYGSKLCSFFAEGSCQKGDQCSFAHSKTEVQFHPKVYKTQACNRFTGSRYCGNKLCAFYHIFDDGSDDSRKPLPEENINNSGSGSPTGSHGFDDHVWLDRTSIFKPPTPPSQFLDMPLLGEPMRRTLKRSNSSSDKVNLDNRSVSNHWSLEFLDAKMKNPNRKESQFGLNLLAWVPDFPLRELIKALYDEAWTVEQLRSYLSHTLVRALEERKVVVSDSGSFAGFNTGLVPPNASYCMIAVLTYSPVQQGTKFEWTLTHFKSPNEVVSSKFLPTVPSPVCYMDNKSDMWFDVNKRILSFGEPLLTRVVDRIAEVRPEVVDLDVFIQMAILEKAMKNTESTVLQNPSLAVPSFYRPKGQLYGSVQFLLPISFSDDPSRVDGALAVQERVTGYVACTVLSLQDAYAHARLIGKPSVDWLNGASINNTIAEPAIKRGQSEEKTMLDKIGSTQLYYHENSVPKVIIVPNDDAGDKEIRESIVAFAKKASLSQYSVRRVDVSGKQALEMYLNHNDYIRMLKSYGRMSSLEVYLKNFFSVN